MGMQPFSVVRNRVKQTWAIKYKDEAGVWRTKAVPKAVQDEEHARSWARDWMAHGATKAYEPAIKPVTVLDVGRRWVEWLGEGTPKGREADTFVRLRLEPSPIASLRADSLTLKDAVSWIEWVDRLPHADFTKRNHAAQAVAMWRDARGHGWVDEGKPNHFEDRYVKRVIGNPEPTAGKDVIIHLPEADACKVALRRPEAVPVKWHAVYLLSLCAGLRRGEVSGLAWRHVDLDQQVVHVERQYTMEGTFKPPKRNSKRSVPLHPLAVGALNRWKAECPNVGPDDPVFPAERGQGYVCMDHMGDRLRGHLSAYGVSGFYEGKHPIDFHALRRTCLTLLTNAGVADADVKELAGHARRGVTRQCYVAASVDRLRRAVALLPFKQPPLRPTSPSEAPGMAKVIRLQDRRLRAV